MNDQPLAEDRPPADMAVLVRRCRPISRWELPALRPASVRFSVYQGKLSASLAELLASQNQEIIQYQRRESQRLGYNIGSARAAEEWFEKYFPAWVREQRQLIDQVLDQSFRSLKLNSEKYE